MRGKQKSGGWHEAVIQIQQERVFRIEFQPDTFAYSTYRGVGRQGNREPMSCGIRDTKAVGAEIHQFYYGRRNAIPCRTKCWSAPGNA